MKHAIIMALSICAAEAAAKTDAGTNRVAKVDVESTSLGRVIDIACEGEPVFTVFRLADPVRIVIDIARGDVSKLDGPIEIGDGVVGDIGTAQFADDRHALGRLIIGLEKAFDYEVKQQGKHIRVTVRAQGPTPVTLGHSAGVSKTARDAQRAEVAHANTELAKADAAKAAEAALSETARAKAEAARVAAANAELQKEKDKIAEAARVSAVLAEAARVAAAKAEMQKTEAAKEAARVAAAKVDADKLAAGKAQAARVAAAKIEADKVVAARAEAARVATAKIEADKVAAAKAEATRIAVVKAAAAAHVAVAKEVPVQQQASHVVVDKLLEKVSVHKRKTGTDVLIRIKGGKPAYEVLELEDPPRVVFDFIGVATRLPKSSSWSLGEVGKLRLGVHEDKIRLVLDGTTALPKYEVIVDASGVRISTELMPSKAAPAPVLVAESKPAPAAAVVSVVRPAPAATVVAVAKPAPAAAVVAVAKPAPAAAVVAVAKPAPAAAVVAVAKPAPAAAVVAAAKPAPAPLQAPIIRTAQISQLDFKKTGDIARLSFALPESAQFELDRSIERAPTLSVQNAELSKTLEKASDVSSLGTAVTRLTSFNDRQGKGLRIIANLGDVATHRVFRENGQLIWEFAAAPKAPAALVALKPEADKPDARPAVEVSMKPVPEVAGFSAEAAQMMRSTTTAQSNANRRINIDVRGADLLNVLRLISDVSGENIVAGDDVIGKITLRLRNVPWEQALDAALRTKGYGRVRSGSIIRVAPLDKLQKEKEAELARMKADEQIQPTFVRLIPINYAQGKDILEQVKQLLTKDRGKASVDERTNTIVAEDLIEVLNKIEGLARRLDTQTPQVLIESRIVEANTQHVRDIGIQWGGSGLFSPATGNATGLAFPNLLGFGGGADSPGTNANGTSDPGRFAVNLPAPVAQGSGGAVGLIFGNASNTGLLSLRLSALENNGSVRIVSAPKVTTLDNVRARISQGVSIPISVTSAAGVNTRFVDAFLELEVKPHVTQDGSIMMEIKATKNEPNFSRTGAQGDPTIDKKVAETQVLVKDGDTTVIGGIYTRTTTTTYNEIPFISKIPVLGWLFKRKRSEDNRAELLVFITPRIVNRQQSSIVAGGGL